MITEDLDLMKEQLHLLHSKLDKEDIVNKRLIHRAVYSKMRSLHREARILSLISLLAIPYCTWVFRVIDLSWALSLTSVLYLTLAICYNAFAHRGLRPSTLATSTLVEVSLRIARFKRLKARWLAIGLPFLLAWFAWFAYEILHTAPLPPGEQEGILTGAGIGALTGIVIGFTIYRRTMRLANDILRQAQEALHPEA